MFDNANASPAFTGVNQTFGVMFQLDVQKKTATVLKRFYDPKETLYAGSQGSFNELCNGNVLMGYGQIPIIKEYGPCGDVRLSIQFGDLNGTQMSYRTFRYNFDTVPATAPAIIAGNGTVYMSWNGATGVTSWDVYEGIHAGKLTYSKAIKNMGFESNTSIRDSTTFVQVVARTKQGVHRKSLVTHVERRVEHGHC